MKKVEMKKAIEIAEETIVEAIMNHTEIKSFSTAIDTDSENWFTIKVVSNEINAKDFAFMAWPGESFENAIDRMAAKVKNYVSTCICK